MSVATPGTTPAATPGSTGNAVLDFQNQIMRLKRPLEDVQKPITDMADEGKRAAEALRKVAEESPFAQTLRRGSQAELQARFRGRHQDRMEKLLREALRKDDRRDEILERIAAKAGIEVKEFSF